MPVRLQHKLNELLADKRFAEILSGSIWTLAAKVVATLLAMLASIYVARVYGAGMTGIVALLNSFVTLVTIFTVLGTNTSVLRLIPEHTKKYSVISAFKVYRKTQYLVVVISIITGGMTYLLAGWIADVMLSKPQIAHYVALAACFVVAQSLMDLNTSAVRGLRLNRVFAFMQILPNIAKLIVLLIGGLFVATQDLAVYALLASWLIPALVGIVIMQVAFQRRINSYDRRATVEKLSVANILAISLPMLMTTSMAFIIGRSGVLILGMYRPEEDVGYYAIAVTLATLTSFVLSAVNSMSASKFSELYHSNQMDELFYVAKKSTKLIFWSTVPILFVLIVFGKFAISLLYGPAFAVAYPALVLLTIGQFVNSISGSTGMFMNMTGHQVALRNIMVLAALLNIGINLLLTPHYGAMGAAAAAMASTIFWNIYALVFIKKRYGQTLGYVPGVRLARRR